LFAGPVGPTFHETLEEDPPMGDVTHRKPTLRKLGDREAYWCVDCNKQWGPYDPVDEDEECAARAGRETAIEAHET
jgi:hypothetical protein